MKSSKNARSHFFRVHFFNGLHMSDAGCHSHKIAKECLDPDVDTFACEKLFTPVNIPGHWFCIAVLLKDKRIVCHDSMCQCVRKEKQFNREDELLLMCRFLVDEHIIQKGKPLPGKWRLDFTHLSSTPQQNDGHSCGVFTVMHADCLSLGCKLDFDANHVINCRNRMALKTLEKDDGTQFPLHSKRIRRKREKKKKTQSTRILCHQILCTFWTGFQLIIGWQLLKHMTTKCPASHFTHRLT